MRKRNEIRFYLMTAAIGLLVAAGCSLGGQSAPGIPVVMMGTMTKGSVLVNGVHFEVSAVGTDALTSLGLTVSLGSAVLKDDADPLLVRSAISSLLEAAAGEETLINVEGSSNGTDTITAVKAELES